MKAISIKQPWAWAIIHGGKPVENRTWYSKYRGKLLIHASKTFDREGYEWIKENRIALNLWEPIPGNKSLFDMGGIVGAVNMIDCVEDYPSYWFSGPYGFLLSNPRPIDFQPCPGRLGIFNIPI